ncbi:MAG: carboxypeptidase-like regulatory domain-containing protein [Ginsengibacter sp.]
MRHILLLFLTYTCTDAFCQIRITGKITDNKSKPLTGVSVSIKDTYDGGSTDSIGNFSFETFEKGEHVLTVTYSGFKDFIQTIQIENVPITINISLKEKITELKAVVISAGAFLAGDQKKAAALSSIDIVTTANANADITGAIKTLPGAQQVGETEGLFVRGGTASESKYFIDGNLVNKFFYSSQPEMATRGRFNPFLFSGTTFSSGGYSALYGQALSSVLLMESIDLPDKTSADFGLSYLAAHAGIQKLAKNKKSSWGATYAYLNLSLVYNLIKQKFDYFQVPVGHEGDFNFRIKTSSGGMVKYYGMLSNIRVGFRNQDADSLLLKNAFALTNLNIYQSISWKENLGNGWKFHLGGSYTNNRDKIKMELQDAENKKQLMENNLLFATKNFKLNNRGNYGNAKLVFEKRLAGLSVLRFGAENNISKENSRFTDYKNNTSDQHLSENILSGFAESDIYLTNQFAAKLGARTEHSQLLQKWNIAPRISLAYQFKNKSQASLAFGEFYQNPENRYLPALNALHFQKATHYIAQYQKTSKDFTFRTELFYKKYDDLIKTSGYKSRETAINNQGFGDAKGIEVFWRDKKTIRNFDYWISYSYLDTKRDFLNYPFTLQPDFSAKHTASLVMKKFVLPLKTQFNASYTFATPRQFYDMAYDGNGKVYIRHEGKTKNFNDLSLSVNYLPAIGKQNAKAFTVIVLSVTNVLGANNIYSYRFSANGNNQLAVTPPAKRFIYIGCFMSLGIDRTEDAINNHL